MASLWNLNHFYVCIEHIRVRNIPLSLVKKEKELPKNKRGKFC